MNKKLIFVSEIKDPYYEDFSSTQIMTNNIIDGLREASDFIAFVALVDSNCNAQNVVDYYSKIVDKVFVIHSHLDLTLHKNKYEQLAKVTGSWLFSRQYDKELAGLFGSADKFDILVSHSPSLEAVSISARIKKHYCIRYVQYWSDPYTIAGILPENAGLKRLPHRLLEKSMLNVADDIVYGTKTLMEFQKKAFPGKADKMRYVDVSYCDVQMADSDNPVIDDGSALNLIYAGDYFSAVRNIEPLYSAMSEIPHCHLSIIGNSDLSLESTKNVAVSARQPYKAVQEHENNSDVIVCVLNRNCIQIPGKIFYRANTRQRILVILDGAYQREIYEYLNSFGRFDFCENNRDSISDCISNMKKRCIDEPSALAERLSPFRIGSSIINGIK